MSLYDLLQTESTQVGAKMEGVFVGIVTNNKDPDGLGRVKVKFPAREGEGESFWARITTLMAGKDYGTFFLPEVNDEVLVAFEQNNINHPYILGCLWNGVDTPPEKNEDGKNNIRTIQSRSGHKIIFNDNEEQKKESLEIQTKAGHRITLDDGSGSEKIEIVDKTGSNSIIFNSTQNSITIECGMALKIKAQTVEIEAGSTMALKAGATMTIQGTLVKIN
jgi:uncharacterized protein involved in type VI secretion and phage assembly